jgi:hypothetical protein
MVGDGMKTAIYEGIDLPVVFVKPWFTSARAWGLVRVTKKFYCIRFNDVYVGKFQRNDLAYAVGDTGRTPSRITKESVAEIEQFVNDGLWDSGWKPKK